MRDIAIQVQWVLIPVFSTLTVYTEKRLGARLKTVSGSKASITKKPQTGILL